MRRHSRDSITTGITMEDKRNDMFALCDIHAHFLPGMDDGCKTVEESICFLECSYEQGVRKLFATPHYYPVESVEAFTERRLSSAEQLRNALNEQNREMPEYLLGAEVAYHPGLGQEQNLKKLCLGNSRYLLLEMPFQQWSGEMLRTVRNICLAGYTPVIAHVERYWKLQSSQTLARLLELDVLVQMNAAQLLRFPGAGLGRRLLKEQVVQLLGSDSHNLTTRPQNLALAAQSLEKHKMHMQLAEVCDLSGQLFAEGKRK